MPILMPLNGVTGHTWHGLPSCKFFRLSRPSVLGLGSGTGQTDGQTDDGHPYIMPPLYGAGHKNVELLTLARQKVGCLYSVVNMQF